MIYGMNEMQVVELLLLVLTTGLIIGTFVGLLVRAMHRLFTY